ncbi:hypothetical protein RchiOBHm_Chr3g0493111 [Rosa chinensis]|uniref:Uncharacterized protein n=1 Tax=Rosa chinensis TaxID=74649 RepID=A0A2P6PRL6_ROSCH|nr:hypothetical protein RchiOBHm_Chr6g0273941 [Rosa chinensis]PRQ45593.1 hypothetical protein RchiOBHm_Chr3g0493111 [Rosa chinensis]
MLPLALSHDLQCRGRIDDWKITVTIHSLSSSFSLIVEGDVPSYCSTKELVCMVA